MRIATCCQNWSLQIWCLIDSSSSPLSIWYLHLSLIAGSWFGSSITRFQTLPFSAFDFSQSAGRFSHTGPCSNIQEFRSRLKGSVIPTVDGTLATLCMYFNFNYFCPLSQQLYQKLLSVYIWHLQWANNIWHSKWANNSSADYLGELILACIKSCHRPISSFTIWICNYSIHRINVSHWSA